MQSNNVFIDANILALQLKLLLIDLKDTEEAISCVNDMIIKIDKLMKDAHAND